MIAQMECGGYARGPGHVRPRTRRRRRLAGCVPADSDTNKACHTIPLEVAGAFWRRRPTVWFLPSITPTSLLFLGFRGFHEKHRSGRAYGIFGQWVHVVFVYKYSYSKRGQPSERASGPDYNQGCRARMG
ncbi:hypothetical protein BJV78DRAFT_1156914 [Lactifluus subvellereus]|nr:hypothetical protein BJV78DRAFT_1156914 [Lactifluus subvellereus]